MEKFYSPFAKTVNTRTTTEVNEGLRKYMLGVYNYMTASLLVTSLVAFAAKVTGVVYIIATSAVGLICAFAPIGIVMYMGLKFRSMSYNAVRNSLFLYAGLMGLSLSTIFIMFTGTSIIKALLITTSMFAGMSIYGYTTKRNLSAIGSIAIMLIWGVLIASIVNIFMRSDSFGVIISFVSVLLFTALTAYDVQKIKSMYYSMANIGKEDAMKLSVFGAFQLYIDFIAIFIHLLNLLNLGRNNR